MKNNNQSFFKKKSVLAGIFLVILIFVANSLLGNDGSVEEVSTETSASPRMVSLYKVSSSEGTAVRSADGSAFIVRSQSAGRVDKTVKVGDVLASGATVAQIENSAQRAALIQAEGSYDAAVAQAGGNVTSQNTAKQDALRTWTNESVAAKQVIYNSIDTYFSFSRNSLSVTGFRALDTFGMADSLNQRRADIEEKIKSWEQSSAQVNESNINEKLTSLSNDLNTIGLFIDDIANLVPRQRINEGYTDEDRATDTSRLASARAAITESLRKLDVASTAILNTSGSNAAMSNAQVKQALGVLESARAAYAKTIIKTPVAGTVTAVSVNVGDIINIGSDVVFVSAGAADLENALTVPLTAVKFTPTKAFVFTVSDNKLVAHEVETGLVTNSSINISGGEGITEVVSDIRGLKEGDVVEIK